MRGGGKDDHVKNECGMKGAGTSDRVTTVRGMTAHVTTGCVTTGCVTTARVTTGCAMTGLVMIGYGLRNQESLSDMRVEVTVIEAPLSVAGTGKGLENAPCMTTGLHHGRNVPTHP